MEEVRVTPEQVIRQVQAHIAGRRAYRPNEECRAPTVAERAEWAEFEQHFRKRKLALGDCYRPYGSDSPHMSTDGFIAVERRIREHQGKLAIRSPGCRWPTL